MRSRLCVLIAILLGVVPIVHAADGDGSRSEGEQLLHEGHAHFQRGAFEDAAGKWRQAAAAYEAEGRMAAYSQTLIRLAEAYQNLGLYQRAVDTLEGALVAGQEGGDGASIATALGGLGKTYLILGRRDAGESYLREAVDRARTLARPTVLARIVNDYGVLLVQLNDTVGGTKAFEESLAAGRAADDYVATTRARINLAKQSVRAGKFSDAKVELDEAARDAHRMQPSREQVALLIAIGLQRDGLRSSMPSADRDLALGAFESLRAAAEVADGLRDTRDASYARGYLGRLYEQEGRYEEALYLTRQAVLAAQSVAAPESLYRWHWQTARIAAAQGRLDDAVAAYRRAVQTLQPIRSELLTVSEEFRASTETVREVFLQLADVLLRRAAQQRRPQDAEPDLIEAREAIELHKAAELRDYFRDQCVDAFWGQQTKLDVVSQTAVVLYPIIFRDRLELLVSVPDGLRRVTVPIGAEILTQEIRAFRQMLEKRTTREYLPHAQQLYDWLVRPLEPYLAPLRIDTLVVVPDGALRTIPMAALHDGRRFLIERYAVAATPGLNLTDPRPIRRDRIKVLSTGLTEAVQGFPPLPNVRHELGAIQSLYGGDQLLDQQFLISNFEQEMKQEPFTIVHIASHGVFESEVDRTFLLTFDDRLTMSRLGQYVGLFRFRSDPLELLTLSACETAAGDDRAALGLAGVAIKAGARSAVATLWFINDEASSSLVTEFYRELETAPTKAAALQRAQMKMIADPVFHHPAYWSPFLLLNNWL